MFCPQCGFQNSEGDGFCGRCGAPLRATQSAGGAAPSVSPVGPVSAGTPVPARKANVMGIAIAGVAALLLGVGGTYVVLSRGTPGPPAQAPSQAAAQTYADPNAHFKIQYPQGWKVFPADDLTVFSPADIGSAKDFDLKQITAPAIVVLGTEKVNREITAAEVFSESGMAKQSIIGQRTGKILTASGAADAMWVDFLVTQPNGQSKKIRGRAVFAARHPGDGTTIKGTAVCVASPEAFAAFEPVCSAALNSYELGQ